MREWNSHTKQACGQILCCLLLLWSFSAKALDSSKNQPQAVVPVSGASPPCTYHYTDSYYGTLSPGSMQTGNSMEISFMGNTWSDTLGTVVSAPSGLTPPVPCNGTYQVTFSIELQAGANVASIVVTPNIVENLGGTSVYPSGTAPASITVYPQCNYSTYTTTPYCTVSWVTGSVQTYLPANDSLALIVNANNVITILGGQIEVVYLHP